LNKRQLIYIYIKQKQTWNINMTNINIYSLILLLDSQYIKIEADDGSSNPRLGSWINYSWYIIILNKKPHMKWQNKRLISAARK